MKQSMLTNGRLKEMLEIKRARELLGLSPLKMKYRNCLRCNIHFFSEDAKNQKNCNSCRAEKTIGHSIRENL